MKKIVILIFLISFIAITFRAYPQIQNKLWDVTLGVSTYKQVEKFANRYKGHYKSEFSDFWGRYGRTIENEYNKDPKKGDVFITPYSQLNFADNKWIVTFYFQNKVLYQVKMRLAQHPTEEYLNSLIDSLLGKYENYFLPDISKEENAYLFSDGKTSIRLELTKDNFLYLYYTDNALLGNHNSEIFNQL